MVKNSMVKSVAFYELNSKNRISVTEIEKEKQKDNECTLSKWLTSISLLELLPNELAHFQSQFCIALNSGVLELQGP